MPFPLNWQTPVSVAVGQVQKVSAVRLLPSRRNLSRVRLDFQQALLDAGVKRFSPIKVTKEGVIWDGHHAVRIAANKGLDVSVLIVPDKVKPVAASILSLPVR